MNPAPATSTVAPPSTQGGGYQGSRNNNSVLWLGDVDPEMDEDFIQESFRLLNVSTTYVKVIRDRETGNPLGYAFVGFDKEETAKRVLEQFNGQLVPNSGAGRKFKMNTAGKNSLNRGFKPNHTRYSGYTSPPNHGDHSTPLNDYHHRPKVYSHGNPNPTAPNHQSQFQSGHQQPQSLPPSSQQQQVGSAGSDATTVSAVAAPITVAANNTTTSSNSSSGNSSGPVSGGSSGSGISSGNIPAQTSSSLRVDNWNPDSLTTTSGQSSGRNSQERGTSGSQERGTSGSQERGTSGSQESGSTRAVEYTAFIGSLDYAISSDALMATFKARYPSVTSGKVILEESSGQSKGFGFVRFTSQAEYKAALEECNGQPMFGGRGIRISEAHPKPPRSTYGSIQSSDSSNFGSHLVGRGGRGQPFRSSDHGVSNGKTTGGKGTSFVGPRDPSLIDQQKINDRIKLMDQVQNGPWYGKQSDGTLLSGPGHNPRNHHQQPCQQGVPNHSIPFGIGVSDLNGAPIMQMPDGSAGYAGYPFWTTPYGQSIPTGYPNPMDQFSLPGNGPQPPAYWSTGTGPNGQPIIFTTDPNQMYQLTDYTAITSGSVPTPFPNVPFTDQTAHMFVPPGMMQAQAQSQQLHQIPSTVPAPNSGMPNSGMPNSGMPNSGMPNSGMSHNGMAHTGMPHNGMAHRSFMANGPDVAHNVMTAPGGPTPPSDTEQHGGIVIPVPGALAGNGWPQN